MAAPGTDDHAGIVARMLTALERVVHVDGVIHVGAHEGQEVDEYLARGCERVLLVEPNPDACRVLRERYADRDEVRIFEVAALDHDGTATLHLHTSRGGSSEPASVLELERFKEIVTTLHTPRSVEVEAVRLDTLLEREGLAPESLQLLVVDVQGAELQVLRGAERVLRAVPAVLTEVQVVELYAGAASEEEIDRFLRDRGYGRIASEYHELYDDRGSFPAWGEALYVRT